MQVRMTVAHDDPVMETFNTIANLPQSEPWEEDFDINCHACWDIADDASTAEQFAKHVIKYFNDTLKPGESRRKLISAKFVEAQ